MRPLEPFPGLRASRLLLAALAAASFAVGSFAPVADAALLRAADMTTLPTSGTGLPKGSGPVLMNTYIAGRDLDSTRPMRLGNPTGQIVITYPPGSGITPAKTGVPVCGRPAGQGRSILDNCKASQIGEGWALVNTGQYLAPGPAPLAREQLSGAPAPCLTESGNPLDWTQYRRFWGDGVLGCVPQGHLWNRVKAFLGSIPEGKTVKDPNAIVFVSENSASVTSFAGIVKGNVLTVNMPALNGNGSYRGEQPFGWGLSDFYLRITNRNYLRVGPCPTSRKWTGSTKFVYSQRKDSDGLIWDSGLMRNRPITAQDIANGIPAETVKSVPATATVVDSGNPCTR